MKMHKSHVVSLCVAVLTLASQLFSQASATDRQKAAAITQQMSLQEKIDYIGGTGFAVRAAPRFNLPALQMSDGPIGVRSNQGFPSTVYAAGIGLAATWNPALAEEVGAGIGKDARARGIHFMLGPGVNIYRQPVNGRNFEYFGEDPFLSSAIAVGYINGMQAQGVSATIKHFLGNNSEFLRHDSDSIIDERTLREIYLPAFEAAVKRAHVGAIMDSYNFTNGEHMTQNGYFNIDVLRRQWGFDGIVMSDWVATYDGVAAANGGLDLEMPFAAFMNARNLMPAIKDGRVKEATIDEKVTHILQTAERFGWLDRDQTDLSLSKYSRSNDQVALDAARESIVLLKNEGKLLPLDKNSIKTVLVVGPDAYPAEGVGGGSADALAFAPVSVVEGIGTFLGPAVGVYYDRGLPRLRDLARDTDFKTEAHGGQAGVKVEYFANADLSGTPKTTAVVPHINESGLGWDTLLTNLNDIIDQLMAPGKVELSRRWTGYYTAANAGAYEIALQGFGEGNGNRVFIDDKLVIDDWKYARAEQPHVTLQLSTGPHKVVVEDWRRGRMGGTLRLGISKQSKLVSEAAKALAAKADVVIVAAGFDSESETEGSDRTFDLPFGQEELIREIAAANSKTIVAVTSGGNVDPGNWLDRIPAYLELWYPGQQGGTALAEILFGAVNPSGHLPATFERRREDNPTFASYYPVGDTNRVVYKEGVFVGYRGYEHNGVKPLFPFGYGLSYTTFKYSNLSVAPASASNPDTLSSVSFDLTNTGDRAGAEVAQVYVADGHSSIPRPAKELKGFSKVLLQPGETRHVTVDLSSRAFAYFDPTAKDWRITPGTFGILVGSSVEDLPLKGSVDVPEAVAAKAKM
jgi:beta-glucosidase